MNKIKVSSDKMYAYSAITPVPKGQVQFSKILFYLSDDWSKRNIIAQFKQGEKTLNRGLSSDNTCYIPSDFDIGPVTVYLKGYGLDGFSIATANGVSIPIVQGAFDGGEPAVPPEPDLYQKLIHSIQQITGDLNSLKTEDKSSLVAAINEIWMSGGGGASVTDAAIDESGHLIITLSTGKTIDAGYAVGPTGPAGADGVGIQSVEQTTTSTEDGGTNVVTVTKTDGTSSTFQVRNGSKGSPGAGGKSAYQYAQEGGYTGTEAEFAAKLAAEMPDALPNPNALTFTGAVTGSYDGSEPLTVNIPSSGGEKAWKRLRSFTLPEDPSTDTSGITWTMCGFDGYTDQIASFEFSTDENGDNFSVREVFIIANMAYGRNTNYFGLADQNGALGYGNLFCNRNILGSKSTLTNMALYVRSIGEHVQGILTTEDNYTGAMAGQGPNKNSAGKDEDITTLKFGTFWDNSILPGSSFEFWGR